MLAAGVVFSGANLAKADIITINATGSPVITATGSTWTYEADLTVNEELVPNQPEFFTLYGFDFGTDTAALSSTTGSLNNSALFSSSVTPTSTTLTEANLVTVPQNTCTTSGCYNIRFTYVGTGTTGPGFLDLGTFTVNSSDTSTVMGFYDGQAMNTSSGQLNGNAGHVLTPSSVPEPMSMGLLGGGLAALGILRLRKSRKA
jgi:hypothetical protein